MRKRGGFDFLDFSFFLSNVLWISVLIFQCIMQIKRKTGFGLELYAVIGA